MKASTSFVTCVCTVSLPLVPDSGLSDSDGLLGTFQGWKPFWDVHVTAGHGEQCLEDEKDAPLKIRSIPRSARKLLVDAIHDPDQSRRPLDQSYTTTRATDRRDRNHHQGGLPAATRLDASRCEKLLWREKRTAEGSPDRVKLHQLGKGETGPGCLPDWEIACWGGAKGYHCLFN